MQDFEENRQARAKIVQQGRPRCPDPKIILGNWLSVPNGSSRVLTVKRGVVDST
jgi:hypothetical protein